MKKLITRNLKVGMITLFGLLMIATSIAFYAISNMQAHDALEYEVNESLLRAVKQSAFNIQMQLHRQPEPITQEDLTQLLTPLSHESHGYAFIFDTNGTILAHTSFSSALPKTQDANTLAHMSSKILNYPQNEYAFTDAYHHWSVAFASIPHTQWKIAIVAPCEAMNERVNYFQNSLFITFIMVLFIALVVAYLLVDTISRYQSSLEKENKERETKLLETQNKYIATLSAIPDVMFELGLDGTYYDCHSPHDALLAASTHEMLGHKVSEILPPQASNICLLALHEANELGHSRGKVIELFLEQGSTWFELSIARKAFQKGDTQPKFIVLSRDITERKKAEEQNHYLANFDYLTGLSNRLQLTNHFQYIVSLAKRNHSSFALLFIDLDYFKEINDSMGHHIGDKMLIELANRLLSIKRESDVVSRLGGDEFMMLLPETDEQGAHHVAQKILALVSKPYLIEEHTLSMTVSIGIALYPYDGLDMETLSKHADLAMYRSKESGRNTYHFFK